MKKRMRVHVSMWQHLPGLPFYREIYGRGSTLGRALHSLPEEGRKSLPEWRKRQTYKIMCNSMYGKFGATTPLSDEEKEARRVRVYELGRTMKKIIADNLAREEKISKLRAEGKVRYEDFDSVYYTDADVSELSDPKEVLHQGEFTAPKLYYFDVCSSYPESMRHNRPRSG